MAVRGIRGATTCNEDAGSVLSAASELLSAIVEANPSLQPEEIVSILFTATGDLNTVYPAKAAREMGWTEIPLMCVQEMNVSGSLPHCIRVLILWNTDLAQSAVRHVYLHDARQLRPDLTYEK